MSERQEHASYRSFPSFQSIDPRPKTRLDRLLSMAADVRGGEGKGVLLMALNLFLLMAAYYLLKPVRKALILSEGGAKIEAYSAAWQAVMLLGVVPAFGALASRVNRVQLVRWVTLFFISNLVLFFVLGNAGTHLGVAFYLWLGIFNVLLPAQLWAFANDLYSQSQGKRLFPLIGVGASLGALLGAEVTSKFVQVMGRYNPMLLASALLLGCIAITVLVHRMRMREEEAGAKKKAEEPLGKEGAFELIFKDRYLQWIALLTVLLNLVNTSGEFLLSNLVQLEAVRQMGAGAAVVAERAGYIQQFYGDFYFGVNLLGLVLQTLFVSRIFHYIGVGGALFLLPGIAFTGYSIMVAAPLLWLVRGIKTLENATDYSIQTTARQALYLPLSREAKYKAKAAIDTLCMRAGDVLQGGVVWAGTALSFSLTQFATLNVALTVAWMAVVLAIYREHKRRSRR